MILDQVREFLINLEFGNQNLLPVKQNITSKFEYEQNKKPYHYEKYLEKQVERPAVTYHTITNPVVYNYQELEYPAPQTYQYSEIREIVREPLPVLNTYERYTGVSSNVQGILEEIKGNKHVGADINNTPNKYFAQIIQCTYIIKKHTYSLTYIYIITGFSGNVLIVHAGYCF